MGTGWAATPTVEDLRAALRPILPAAAAGTIVPRGLAPSDDPRWCAASAVVDDRWIVKFAWSEQAAQRIAHQAQILEVLHRVAPTLPLPEVVAQSRTPAMLVTRRIPVRPFFEVRHLVGVTNRDRVADDLATVLAQLHAPEVLRAAPAAAGTGVALGTDSVDPPRGERWRRVREWCDWADEVLATPSKRKVLIHGDFHGDNHLWDPVSLRLKLVVDLETAAAGEAEFDLRCLPGDCGMELFTATADRYEQLTGATLDRERIMAWHLRTVLADMRWRCEANVPLPDRRTPEEWVDDLTSRLER
ncbi:aminoglycoside phosphotransferase family protein [Actinoplanes sp. LDG1-06]|uniref:Aminoglycoside phosphotransferase family protein n=1 Tax=Paractinoplanes ovalisporus TaxID=2810368 RepID=A0ABS2AAG1_9ACTN|nr:aminoglycoside phosphotransferase family protein [Actinoplanes ovalisporus]MBM2616803.1 aminoglycoside phosphotransferase family protein [Actinoplanes ovalisporus]